MQCSSVSKSELNEELRIDSEYYSPENLRKEDAVTNHKYELLGNLCDLIAGPFGSAVTTDRYDPDSEKRYIRGKDIQSFFLEKNDAVYVEQDLFNELSQFHLKEQDVLLTVVGMKFGKVAIIYNEDLPAIFSCKSTLIRNPRINIWYLLAYLACNVGYGLIRRGQRGAAQPGINLFDIQTVPVPLFGADLEFQVERTIKESKITLERSIELFAEAQTLLLSELGLTDWQPKHQLTFINNYSDTEHAERIDAEYYQPKYDELLQLINQNSNYTKVISEIQIHNARGLQPKYSRDGSLDVITSKHILENGLDVDNFDKTDTINWNLQKKARVKKGSILTYTTGANIGRTAIYQSEKQALASNHVNILTIKEEDPNYVAFVMNSLIGRLQTDRLSAGSAQAELYPQDIGNFIIPFIEKGKEIQIQQNVAKSFNLRKQSKHLLECAQRVVEMAIEQDEQTAITWLENETKKMQI